MKNPSLPSTPQAVIYARVSSKEQEKEGFSIPAQLRLLHEYARSANLNVVREVVDIETAKRTGRQNFEAMLTFFRRTRSCQVLLVEKTSLRSRGVPAVGWGDDHLPDLSPTRHHARWFRPSRPSALRL
jgi:DNA invertase Pin-like site-specific DNA recombinase